MMLRTPVSELAALRSNALHLLATDYLCQVLVQYAAGHVVLLYARRGDQVWGDDEHVPGRPAGPERHPGLHQDAARRGVHCIRVQHGMSILTMAMRPLLRCIAPRRAPVHWPL